MKKYQILSVMALVMLLPLNVYADPFPAGIPPVVSNNDGPPDIYNAFNRLVGTSHVDNSTLGTGVNRHVWDNGSPWAAALIGLTAGNTNTLGYYSDVGTGSVKTALFADSGFGFAAAGTQADPYIGRAFDAPTPQFGWYLQTAGEDSATYFSEPQLNTSDLNGNQQGYDHMMTFDLNQDLALWVDFDGPGGAPAQQVIFKNASLITWEDLPFSNGDSDKDYDDMIYVVGRVAPIPEPATMLLLGSGLIGLAGYARRRFKK